MQRGIRKEPRSTVQELRDLRRKLIVLKLYAKEIKIKTKTRVGMIRIRKIMSRKIKRRSSRKSIRKCPIISSKNK